MRYTAEVGERSFEIEIKVDDSGTMLVSLDRDPYEVDIQCVDGHRLYSLMVGNRSYGVFIDEVEGRFLVTVQGRLFEVSVRDEFAPVSKAETEPMAQETLELPVKAPMPGIVKEVNVAKGDYVSAGTRLLILEAMKMENEIVALRDGTVSELRVAPGQRVGHGDILLVML